MVAGIIGGLIFAGGLFKPGIETALITGGLVGTLSGGLLARLLGSKYSRFFQDQIDKGGLLLWVQTKSKKKEKMVSKVFKRNKATDIHGHSSANQQKTDEEI